MSDNKDLIYIIFDNYISYLIKKKAKRNNMCNAYLLSRTVHAHIVLQMENCSDGFNVPREHTAKLYIVGKTLMWSIGQFCSYE